MQVKYSRNPENGRTETRNSSPPSRRSDVFVRALTDHVLDFKFSVVRVNLFLIIYLIHFGLGDDHLILRGWGLKDFLMNLLVFVENKDFDLEDGGKIFYSPRFTRIHT